MTMLAAPPAAPHATQEAQFQDLRAKLVAQLPPLDALLPTTWPPTSPALSLAQSLASLRRVTAMYNEGLLIIGFGNGSVLELIRQDPIGRSKLIHVMILPHEIENFAHALGALDMRAILMELNINLHCVRDAGEVQSLMTVIYNDHEQIARLAGTAILDDHPLNAQAQAERTALMPHLRRAILERYDCLGNDVYDTFLGAKHTLMHGERLFRQRRSGHYVKRYAGASAICIASGPSAPAYFDRIRAIQHEHVIICADSILGALVDHGIEPDFVCMVERPDTMHKLVDDHAGRTSAMLFALPVVHPSSALPFGDRVAWWWNADELYPWIDAAEPVYQSGRSTGTMTVALAALLGVAQAYLVGHDLAFTDGQSHCTGVSPEALKTQASINRDLSRHSPNTYRRLVDAPRNGGGTVETMGVWDIFRADIEHIILCNPATTFINTNIQAQVGAVIAKSIAGDLPAARGVRLVKSHPDFAVDEAKVAAYRARCRQLASDFSHAKSVLDAARAELAAWKPLAQTRSEVEAMGNRVDLTAIVSPENKAWFGYVFRAALRNLMLRLHYNTFVRTMAERNWNQVQIMRLYTASVPQLIDHLTPELTTALEALP